MIIKNKTPYLGSLSLKFEKHPEYRDHTILNQIHLDLGFTKLVSRMKPTQTLDGFKINPKAIELIEMYTEGKIGSYTFGPNGEHTLDNSFLSMEGQYIGNIEDAWWYFKNGMTVCEEHPNGVAIVWNTALNGRKALFHGQDGINGYLGYSHRGGAIFRIGDRIFDPNYEPQPHHYSDDDWFQFKQKAAKTQKEYDRKGFGEKVQIADVIPFKLRGKRTICDWGDALDAAINLSNHLS